MAQTKTKDELNAASQEATTEAANTAEQVAGDTEQQKPQKEEDPNQKIVKFVAPLDLNAKSKRILIGVNGRFWNIERGVEVEVPAYVVKAYNDSVRQTMACLGLQEKAEKNINLTEG